MGFSSIGWACTSCSSCGSCGSCGSCEISLYLHKTHLSIHTVFLWLFDKLLVKKYLLHSIYYNHQTSYHYIVININKFSIIIISFTLQILNLVNIQSTILTSNCCFWIKASFSFNNCFNSSIFYKYIPILPISCSILVDVDLWRVELIRCLLSNINYKNMKITWRR